jgi:hypothetical protein
MLLRFFITEPTAQTINKLTKLIDCWRNTFLKKPSGKSLHEGERGNHCRESREMEESSLSRMTTDGPSINRPHSKVMPDVTIQDESDHPPKIVPCHDKKPH